MQSTTKLAGIAGISWGALNIAAGMTTGQPPELDAPAAEIRSYIVDHRSAYLVAIAVFALTLPALFAFFGELTGRVRGGAASAALGVAAVGLSLAYLGMLPFIVDKSFALEADASLLRYAWMATFLITMIGNIGFASLLLALAINGATTRRADIAAGAIGVLTLVVSVLGLVSTSVTVAAGTLFLLPAVWMIVVGIGMTRNDADAPAATLAPAGV